MSNKIDDTAFTKDISSQKMNIVIVQAFPANHTLSSGIIKFLEDYFRVYFIDLPGFYPEIPPLEKITIPNYAHYVEKRLEELNLDSYILAGISFGFIVISNMNIDKTKCLSILGSGPYLGSSYLNFSKFKIYAYSVLVWLINFLKIMPQIWNKRWFKKLSTKFLFKDNPVIINTLLAEVDPNTFIKTAKLILSYNENPKFHTNIPYALLINPKDSSINFNKTIQKISEVIPMNKLRCILTNVEHYPHLPNYEYFKQAFSANEIESLFDFVNFSNSTSNH